MRKPLCLDQTSGHRISIDPGISGTGIAIWKELDWEKRKVPVFVKNLYPKNVRSTKQAWLARVSSIMEQLDGLFNEWGPIRGVYSEFPELMEGTRGRAASVSKNNLGYKEPGDILKMLFLVGAIGELCRIYGCSFTYYLPSDWKGNLPKDVVESRVKLRIPRIVDFDIASHCWDACGIGLFAKGFL
jgi:hypothetical protein